MKLTVGEIVLYHRSAALLFLYLLFIANISFVIE